MEKKIRKCLSARDLLVLVFIIMEYYVSFLCFKEKISYIISSCYKISSRN